MKSETIRHALEATFRTDGNAIAPSVDPQRSWKEEFWGFVKDHANIPAVPAGSHIASFGVEENFFVGKSRVGTALLGADVQLKLAALLNLRDIFHLNADIGLFLVPHVARRVVTERLGSTAVVPTQYDGRRIDLAIRLCFGM